jgi:hypothetical protein
MERSLRRTGLVAVATVWLALLAATAVARFDLLGGRPLSYLGTQSSSAALFAIGLAVPALLLTAFHFSVRERFPVAPGFSAAMLAGLAGQVVAAFVPIDGAGALHRIHTTSALVLGASLPLLMWRFAAGQPQGRWRRLAYALFWAEAAACAAGVLLSSLGRGTVAEIFPAVVFHAWVVTVSLASSGSPAPAPGTADGDSGRSPAAVHAARHLGVAGPATF